MFACFGLDFVYSKLKDMNLNLHIYCALLWMEVLLYGFSIKLKDTSTLWVDLWILLPILHHLTPSRARGGPFISLPVFFYV
jgi:hypothetical protein